MYDQVVKCQRAGLCLSEHFLIRCCEDSESVVCYRVNVSCPVQVENVSIVLLQYHAVRATCPGGRAGGWASRQLSAADEIYVSYVTGY